MNDKKTCIYKAVFSLLNTEDFSKITISKIAAHASIGKGTVYEYFDSKEDIFCCTIEAAIDFFWEKLNNEIFCRELSFKETTFSFIDMNCELIKNNKSFFDLIINPPDFLLKDKKRRDKTQKKLFQFKDQLHGSIKRVLLEAKESGQITMIDDLRQTLFLPMFMSFILRLTNLGFWHDIKEDVDREREKEEFYGIILKMFS